MHAGLFSLLMLFPMFQEQSPALERHEFSQRLMGMPFQLIVYAPSSTAANEAAASGFGAIRRLNAIFSDYEPESELNRLCRTAGTGEAVSVSSELMDILQISQKYAELSGGQFDVSVGPLVRLWRKARKAKQLPKIDEIQAAREKVGFENIVLDPVKRTVILKRPGMQLDLGGIAVGYALDVAGKELREKGFSRFLIDGSGDILVGEAPPERDGWRIGIASVTNPEGNPEQYAMLKNMAISTSGDAFQHIEIDGQRYSHIVDPDTGLGLTDRSSVTVISTTCTAADALATTVSLLGPTDGLKLLENIDGSAVYMVLAPKDDQPPETFSSKRLGQFLIPK